MDEATTTAVYWLERLLADVRHDRKKVVGVNIENHIIDNTALGNVARSYRNGGIKAFTVEFEPTS